MTLDELRALATVKDGPHLRFQPPYQQMSVSLDEAELLYALVRALKPRNVLELGTGLGLSGRFIAEALVDNGDVGEMISVEPNQEYAEQARELLAFYPVSIVSTYDDLNGWPDLVYIDSAASRRPHDIAFWLTTTCPGLILVHDSEREYSALEHGTGVYLQTASGMWLGRAK